MSHIEFIYLLISLVYVVGAYYGIFTWAKTQKDQEEEPKEEKVPVTGWRRAGEALAFLILMLFVGVVAAVFWPFHAIVNLVGDVSDVLD